MKFCDGFQEVCIKDVPILTSSLDGDDGMVGFAYVCLFHALTCFCAIMPLIVLSFSNIYPRRIPGVFISLNHM